MLDAVEIAAMSIHDKAKTADEYETDTVKLAMTSADDEPPFDVDEPQKPELVLKPADENGLDISADIHGETARTSSTRYPKLIQRKALP